MRKQPIPGLTTATCLRKCRKLRMDVDSPEWMMACYWIEGWSMWWILIHFTIYMYIYGFLCFSHLIPKKY
jgi:hypothetical protein